MNRYYNVNGRDDEGDLIIGNVVIAKSVDDADIINLLINRPLPMYGYFCPDKQSNPQDEEFNRN